MRASRAQAERESVRGREACSAGALAGDGCGGCGRDARTTTSIPIHGIGLGYGVGGATGILPVDSWRLWCAQLYFLVGSPVKYLTLLICLMKQPYLGQFRTYFPRRLIIFLKAIALARILRYSSISLIHTHFAWLSGAAARVISDLLGIPYTVTVHAYDIYSSNDLLCFTARSAAQVIAISEYNKQMVLQLCPDLEGDSISVIHCGISLDLFTPRPQP